jgi:signal transduction histidine kinase
MSVTQEREPGPGRDEQPDGGSARAAATPAGWLSDEHSYRVLASLLLAPDSPEEVCARIVELTADLAPVATCSVFLVDQSGEFLQLAATNNPPLRERVGELTHRVGEGLTGWVARYRQPVLIRDPHDPGERARLADPARGLPVPDGAGGVTEGPCDGWLAVPITDVDARECIGVIRVTSRVPWLELTRADVDRLLAIGRLAYLVAQNARLREQQVEAAEANALRELTAKVAHLVGNRLYAIGNLLEALRLTGGGDPAGILDQMRGILASAGELLRSLVRQSSLPPLNPRPYPVADLLRGAGRSCVPCELSPAVTIGPGVDLVFCDPEQLQTALGEIVQNCVEICGPGAELRLEASQERRRTVIAISDNGPGVPEENKKRIFEPLFTTRPGGTGWGLVTAREIVEKHGGTLTEEGAPGRGACFVIRLPRRKLDALSPAAGR